MKKKILVLTILILSFVLILLFIPKLEKKEDNFKIVTSFYPVYVITSNIAKDIEGVEVVNVAPNNIGCIHDYTLTTNDMKKIEDSNAFVINGAGMEEYVSDILDLYNLNIIDSSNDISLLESNHHHEEEHDEEEHEEYNPHIWINPYKYIEQIKNVTDGLIKLNPENKEKYLDNEEEYINKVNSLVSDIEILKDLTSKDVLIFHESFEYLEDILNINIKHTVPIDADEALTTSMLQEVIDIIKENNIKIILIEDQFDDSIMNLVKNEVDVEFYKLNSLVSGDDSLDSYINGYRNNISILKEALK